MFGHAEPQRPLGPLQVGTAICFQLTFLSEAIEQQLRSRRVGEEIKDERSPISRTLTMFTTNVPKCYGSTRVSGVQRGFAFQNHHLQIFQWKFHKFGGFGSPKDWLFWAAVPGPLRAAARQWPAPEVTKASGVGGEMSGAVVFMSETFKNVQLKCPKP